MKMKLPLLIIAILLSGSLFADGYYPEPITQDQPWSISASIGNGKYQSLHNSSSKSALGRLALGNDLVLTGDFAWGLELGIQNGNKMHLAIPSETLAFLQWLPVQTSLGQMLDLLVTAKSDPLAGSSFFAQVKGGIAYRKWQIEHEAINNLSQIAGEIQAGFGYPITTLASLNLLYQGVFGNDPNLVINPYTRSGHLANIPSLHAVLLGLSVNL
jgi:hypothetical protein